mgnify:CR=1 FL=1
MRRSDALLVRLLDSAKAATHPFVIGEIACGTLANRPTVLALLQDLPMATVADSDEVLNYIERHKLHGKGIGYVDAHLLAAVALSADALLWTRDKRLHAMALSLRSAYVESAAH